MAGRLRIAAHPVPHGYFSQFKYPFQKDEMTQPPETASNDHLTIFMVSVQERER